jgi:hypothetical protein
MDVTFLIMEAIGWIIIGIAALLLVIYAITLLFGILWWLWNFSGLTRWLFILGGLFGASIYNLALIIRGDNTSGLVSILIAFIFSAIGMAILCYFLVSIFPNQ